MPATVRMSYASGAGPTLANAETGIVFTRMESQVSSSGQAPVPIPNSPGTNYSWLMQLILEVTGAFASSISNRAVAYATAETANIRVWFAGQATYRQAAIGNKPADVGTQPLTTPTPAGAGAPGSYAAVTTTPQVWSAGSVSAGATGANGDYLELVSGVDNNYNGGSGQAAHPQLNFTYDEV